MNIRASSETTTTPDTVSPVSRRYLLLVSAMASFLVPFMGSSINIALPAIGKEFSLGAIWLAWLTTSYVLTAAAFLVPVGRISDIYGRKNIFAAGIALYTFSSFIAAIAYTPHLLIVSRIMQGIAGAMIFSTPVALLSSVFGPAERGRALGYNVAAVYIGLSLGPFFGGILTQSFGWHSIFYVHTLLGLITLVFAFWKLHGIATERVHEPFDLVGSLLYAISLIMLMYGFSNIRIPLYRVLAVCGAAGLVVFWLWEMRTKYPVFETRLFRYNRVFALSNIATLINYNATTAVIFLLSLYLQYIKGFSPKISGLILVTQPAIQALFSPLAGTLSDTTEPRIVASVGMALTAVGLTLLACIQAGTSLWFVSSCLILLGFGFALFSSPNTNAVMSSVEKTQYGVASGILGTMRLIGQMFSMSITTLVFSVYMGSAAVTIQNQAVFIRAMQVVLGVLAVLCYVGISFSLARGRVR